MISVHHTVIKNNTSKDINFGTFVLAGGVTVLVPSHFIKVNKVAVAARRARQIEVIPLSKYKGKPMSLVDMNKLLSEAASTTTVSSSEAVAETPVAEAAPEVVTEVVPEEALVAEAAHEEAPVAEEETVDTDVEELQSTEDNSKKRVRKPAFKK